MAAWPRVGPTTRCSMTFTGTGSAPPLISSRQVLGLLRGRMMPVIWVEPPAIPTWQATSASTCGEEMTLPSSTNASRRVGSPAGAQAALAVACCQIFPPFPWKPMVTYQF